MKILSYAMQSDTSDASISTATAAELDDLDSRPVVSVVMPAFNATSTLDRAVRSVLAQTESSLELIIVNDGSTDDTAVKAGAWANRYCQIRVVNQPNKGASHARNRGISEARGDWIVFLDSDDTLDRRHIALMLKAVSSTPNAGAAACGWIRVDRNGRRTMSLIPTRDSFKFESIYTRGPPTVIHAFLLSRHMLLREGGFDVRFKTGEDWDLWIRLARIGLQYAIVPKGLALYWDSGGSLTKDVTQVIRDDIAVRQLARLPDPRISKSLPEYATGLRRDIPQQDLLVSVMYWGATRLGTAQRPPGHLLQLVEPFGHTLTPREVAHILHSGLEMLSPGGQQGIAAHWPHFAESLWAFLQAFEAWAGTPGIAIAILYEVELECLRSSRLRGVVTLTQTVGVNLLSPAALRGVSMPTSADRLIVRARALKSVRIMANIPLFGPVSGLQIQAAVFHRMIRHMERKALGAGLLAGCLRRTGRLSPAANRLMRAFGFGRQSHRNPPDSLARILEEEKRKIATWEKPATAPHLSSTQHPEEDSAKGWDRFYEQVDPWDYGNPYEQQKYDDTLELIPDVDGDSLEIACSEGRFTERLASKTKRLLAIDISANALARAARRCAHIPAVKFKQLDVFQEELGGAWSLIVCSEILYYLPDKNALRVLIDRLLHVTQPRGYFIHAHARSINDDTSRSGFDWGVPFGADFIAEALSKAGFIRLRTIDREIYRVDLFQRPPISLPDIEPETIVRGVTSRIPPRVAGGIVWRGAVTTRSTVESAVRRSRLPVLAYHRIATGGPDHLAPWRLTPEQFEEQLIFLRRRGYRSCSPAEMVAGAERSGSLQGRPVLITFDDGYSDFYENAWPILQRNGFSAHNFIVTERVGGNADWDARWGTPAPLMNWDQIVRLAAEGITFGSHLATHTASTHLRGEALFREALNSRLKLEKVLETPIHSVATPFGESSDVVELILARAGYRQHFGNHLDCFAPVSSNWMSIPRLFVTSDLDIQAFANLMHQSYEAPEAADRPAANLAS